MASPSYPFYFAWVGPDETTFGAQHEVVDEEILAFTIKHDEGQIPTMEIVVKNPRVGLLNAGRKVWAWFSYQPPAGGDVVPLFFGELVGVPSNIFSEVITMNFHARPSDYIVEKQKVAEAMKIAPYWDPVFIDQSHRDNPDAILEGWSSLFHVDRVTHAVSASDILTGEDGNVDFGAPTTTHAFYDSLSLHVGEAPLTAIRVEANVRWTQRYDGLINWPTVSLSTYSGDGFMSEWPHAGATLGGGYRVEASFVDDVYRVALTPQTSYSGSWTNPDQNKEQCAPESITQSSSGPALLSPDPISCTTYVKWNTGICDPYSDPPDNTPAHSEASGIIVPQWFLNCDMKLRYDAKRQFTEELEFNVLANTQGVLTSPGVSQHTELLKVSGADVGEPLEVVDAWTDFAGKAVGISQIIFPNNPDQPGGTSWQICAQAGTAGNVEPVFSDVPGTVTVDGTVHWASLGSSPLTVNGNWTPASPVPVGEIICFVPERKEMYFNQEAGNFEPSLNEAAYYICIREGVTNSHYSNFSYTPPAQTSDASASVPVVVTYIADPGYNQTPGAIINDGSVQWMSLGVDPPTMHIPIGGTPLRVPGRCYFPTARGKISVEHLICKARARLRHRARCIRVGWEAPFEQCVALSCRKDAKVQDPRLPGGSAQGKVISYELCLTQQGRWYGRVEIGCSVGYSGTVNADAGTGDYAESGYMQAGYQHMVDATVTPTDNNDIGYSPLGAKAYDDGISFPIHSWREIDGGSSLSDVGAQKAALQNACPITQELTLFTESGGYYAGPGGRFKTYTNRIDGAWAIVNAQQLYSASTIQGILSGPGVVYTLFLRPLTNGPFNGSYSLDVTPLELPMGINLEAASL